jgi:hypothetical protein
METSWYQGVKLALESMLGLSKDALHVYVGLAVFLGASVVFRKPLSSVVPLALVVLAALAGEALDMRDDLASLGHWRWQASLGDIANTVLVPMVIWTLARFRVIEVADNTTTRI